MRLLPSGRTSYGLFMAEDAGCRCLPLHFFFDVDADDNDPCFPVAKSSGLKTGCLFFLFRSLRLAALGEALLKLSQLFSFCQ